jgi:hypothetical protein
MLTVVDLRRRRIGCSTRVFVVESRSEMRVSA